MEFPLMVKVRQRLASAPLADPLTTLDRGLESAGLESALAPGARVAVAVGSRKIDREAEIVTHLLSRLKESGCYSYIVPAMGSHGGATPEGQVRVLAGLGISEATVGAPVRAGVESVSLGTTPGGAEAYFDSLAIQADGIVLVNRVAPHTAFSGPVESGLAKMMAAGLGNRQGARSLHRQGFGAGHLIGEIADRVLECAPVAFGIALVEDGTKELSRLEVLPRGRIATDEPGLLDAAVSMYPRIPVPRADLLIVDEMGKDISGIGMDPLITGRGKETVAGRSPSFTADRLVVLGISPGSGGNATGIGHADATTERLVRSIDRWVTYRNVMTSGALFRAKIPVMMQTDRDAVAMALESLGGLAASDAKVVRIRNTAQIEEFQVSASLAGELSKAPGVEIDGEARALSFDMDGHIV